MLRHLLQRASRSAPPDPAARRRLAIAVLLLETARADFEHGAAELDLIRRELGSRFGLAEEEIEGLIGQARDAAGHAVSLHDFVGTVNATLDTHDKHALLGLLWKVAYADGRLDPLEEHLIRRLSELLHIPHRVFIQKKLEASGA